MPLKDLIDVVAQRGKPEQPTRNTPRRLTFMLAQEQNIKEIKVVGVEPNHATDLVLYVQNAHDPDAETFVLLATIGVKRQFIKLFDRYELEDEQQFVGVHLIIGEAQFHPYPAWEIKLTTEWEQQHKLRG